MIIVGELINASRKTVKEAIENHDEAAIRKLALDQQEAGADYIDVNAGVFGEKEPDYLKWLVETVQSAADVPCCIDSPDPKAIEAALSVHSGSAMVNSISLEHDRYETLLSVVRGTDMQVVALCMSDEGMPETVEQRLAIADRLIEGLVKNDVAISNIYVDPLVQPVATNSSYGTAFLEAIERIMNGYPGIHTMCGLSNISFGLPCRKFLNQTFMAIAIACGLDGAIVNPLDLGMIANIRAAEALVGRDDFCFNFIKAYRAGMLEKRT